MRVLGVDPGLTRCGLGAVDGMPGRKVKLVAVDVIRTPAAADLGERLLGISQAVGGWLDQLHPDVLAVEQVFSQSNLRTVMGTAQAAGVAIEQAALRGIPIVTHTPSQVKSAVTGSGKAGKVQVTAMVQRILALPAAPKPADAADALALAICHLWRADATPAAAGNTTATPAQRQWAQATAQTRTHARQWKKATG